MKKTYIFNVFWLLLFGLLLGACSDAVPTGTSGLKGPAKWSMAKKCALPDYPEGDGDMVVRADYDVRVRLCAIRRGNQVDALQNYVRRVAKKS